MTKIRLLRMGRKRAPHYRIVVADARAPRDGRHIEVLGYYNPMTSPSTIKLDLDGYNKWIGVGAQPTDTVKRIVKNLEANAGEE
ncbi:MAG: 30S ribosomal protein S16 [Myxococcota bacterium]